MQDVPPCVVSHWVGYKTAALDGVQRLVVLCAVVSPAPYFSAPLASIPELSMFIS